MIVFKGHILLPPDAGGYRIHPVSGIVRPVTLDDGRKSYAGIITTNAFRHSGFFDFDLLTDIGFNALVRVKKTAVHHKGHILILHFITPEEPKSLPPDGSLGE
jgi:hypothetical protein